MFDYLRHGVIGAAVNPVAGSKRSRMHELPAEAPVFASESATWHNHPEVSAHEE